MNRSSRGHKSTKIPNVKLRPAPAASSSSSHDRAEREATRRQTEREDAQHYRRIRREAEAARGGSVRVGAEVGDSLQEGSFTRHADEEDEDDADEFDKPDVLPLTGVIICFSSISDHDKRLMLTRQATQLGAQVESDLRGDVHYLICESVGSPKYHEALERGKLIVLPSWLVEVQRRYQNDLPYDWKNMLITHRVRPLQGYHLIFTGYQGIGSKALAAEKAEELGARVSNQISGDNGITHVVSHTNKPGESRLVDALISMREGHRKGTIRTESTKKIVESVKEVWPEWLEDCDRVCGALRESQYSLWRPKLDFSQRMENVQRIRDHYVSGMDHPSVAFHERLSYQSSQRLTGQFPAQRAHAGVQTAGTQTGLRKAPALAAILQQSRVEDPGSNRRAVSEGARTNGMDGRQPHSELLNQSRASRFSEPAAAAKLETVSHSDGKRKAVDTDDGRDPWDASIQPPSKLARGTASDRRPNPFARSGVDLASTSASRSPFARLKETTSESPEPEAHQKSAYAARRAESEPSISSGDQNFFRNYKFRLRLPSRDQEQSTWEFLESYGATVIDSSDVSTKADFTVVPFFYPFEPLPREGKLVTKFFIEECEAHEAIIPLDSFGSQPSPHSAPLPGAKDLLVYFTGFTKARTSQLKAETIISAAGGRTVNKMSLKGTTHLICTKKVLNREVQSDKVELAQKWGIPIVGYDFVKRMMEKGKIDPPCPPPRAARSAQSRSNSDSSMVLGPTQSESMPPEDRSNVDSPAPARSESSRRTESPTKPEFPLRGVFLAWSTIAVPDSKFQAQAQALGAVIVPLGSAKTTHLLHKGALAHDCAAGLVSAQVQLVHPEWLRACLATKSQADERLYAADLGRPAPLVEATPRENSDRVPEANRADAAMATDGPGSTPAPSPFLALKASSSAPTEAGSEEPPSAMQFPDTCGETARVMAALNADLDASAALVAAAAHSTMGAHGAAPAGGRRKLRPQRALGRTGSNGSATTEVKPPEPEEAAAATAHRLAGPSDTAISFDAAGWATQVNVLTEEPPIAVRVSYEDDGKKERAKLLAALERGQGLPRRAYEEPSRYEEDSGGGSGGGGSGGGGSYGRTNGKSSGTSSKNRIQARRQPGSRH
ncbi:protein kinase activating protein dpb11 [Tilletia horrida]|uniref:Protein kinase activating protein dpb11 n=1 Tax=Tilletia horrida TaxID=155126 RepID=A0AAN6JKP9_9BASI|nr:protein kinase activating protein dpb11 [Tilletia horrida]